jgi:hypothetical protein
MSRLTPEDPGDTHRYRATSFRMERTDYPSVSARARARDISPSDFSAHVELLIGPIFSRVEAVSTRAELTQTPFPKHNFTGRGVNFRVSRADGDI